MFFHNGRGHGPVICVLLPYYYYYYHQYLAHPLVLEVYHQIHVYQLLIVHDVFLHVVMYLQRLISDLHQLVLIIISLLEMFYYLYQYRFVVIYVLMKNGLRFNVKPIQRTSGLISFKKSQSVVNFNK